MSKASVRSSSIRCNRWSFIRERGTGGHIPSMTTPVSLLNVQGLRYAEDNGRTDLAELGMSLEIAIHDDASGREAFERFA